MTTHAFRRARARCTQYARRSVTATTQVVVATLVAGMFCIPANAQISFTNASDTHLNGSVRSESWGLSVGDVNGDYWPDIFVGNHRNRPSLYQANPQGTFDNTILQVDPGAAWVGNRYIDTHGGAFADYDGDGDDDLVVGTNAATFHFFMHSNNGVFSNQVQQRLGVDTSSAYSLWFDYNKDGLTDLFQGRDSSGLSVYFPQDSIGGTFTGQGPRSLQNCDGDWAFLSDINDDGQSDYVCNTEGTFPLAAYDLTDISFNTPLTATLPQVGNVVDSLAADFNNDLKADLLLVRGAVSASGIQQHNSRLIAVSSDTGSNEKVIFSFNGGGSLTVRAWFPPAQTSTTTVTGSRSLAGFDFVYDAGADRWTISRQTTGWEYAYLQINSTTPMSNVNNVRVSRRDRAIQPELYRRGNGNWNQATASSGLNIEIECKAAVAADFDNDMDQDLYFVCGRGAGNIANRLFANNGSGYFTEVANAGGARGETGAPIKDAAGSGENVVTGDFNNDGFIDLFVVNGNNSQPVRGRVGKHELMLNNGNSNHWVELELIGTTSDASAAGARVIATAGGVSQLRETGAVYHRWSQNDDRVHFGLGSNTSVNIQVRWPSGNTEYFNNINADSLYTITEGGGVAPINPGSPAGFAAAVSGDECGVPNYFRDMDSGVFVYRNCATNRWQVRAITSRSKLANYTGRLTSSQPASAIAPQSTELADAIDSSDATDITFAFKTNNTDEDGFDLNVPSGAQTCFGLTGSTRQRFYLGSKHVPVNTAIDLNTMTPCSHDQGGSTLSINSVSVSESAGTGELTVTLSPPSAVTVTALVVSEAISASQGQDYYGFSTAIEFAPGQTTKTLSVTVLDDTLDEPNETLRLRLLNTVGATALSSGGVLTIIDNDSPSAVPTLSISDISASETAGLVNVLVTLTPANNAQSTSVQVASSVLSATPGQDYYGFYRALTFAPGVSTQSFTVSVLNDSAVEGNEQLGVRMFGANGATIATPLARLTIIDDDSGANAPPVLVNPGNQASTIGSMVSLSLSAADADGDALTYSAIRLPQGLSISANGVISGTPNALQNNSVVIEVSDGRGGSDTAAFAWQITTASQPPKLSVDDVTIVEGNGPAIFTVTLDRADPSNTISVSIAAQAESAGQGQDYYGFFRTLTFAPNQVSKTVSVSILNDANPENTETMRVRMFNESNATIARRFGRLTIIDDD